MPYPVCPYVREFFTHERGSRLGRVDLSVPILYRRSGHVQSVKLPYNSWYGLGAIITPIEEDEDRTQVLQTVEAELSELEIF